MKVECPNKEGKEKKSTRKGNQKRPTFLEMKMKSPHQAPHQVKMK